MGLKLYEKIKILNEMYVELDYLFYESEKDLKEKIKKIQEEKTGRYVSDYIESEILKINWDGCIPSEVDHYFLESLNGILIDSRIDDHGNGNLFMCYAFIEMINLPAINGKLCWDYTNETGATRIQDWVKNKLMNKV